MLRTLRPTAVLAALAAALVSVAIARADATPVGPLPAGKTQTILVQKGELVAMALPHRPNGRVWRVARAFDSRVLRQVSEADVGASVVVVFKAVATGKATVVFGLTRGETAKAFDARRYVVQVR